MKHRSVKVAPKVDKRLSEEPAMMELTRMIETGQVDARRTIEYLHGQADAGEGENQGKRAGRIIEDHHDAGAGACPPRRARSRAGKGTGTQAAMSPQGAGGRGKQGSKILLRVTNKKAGEV